ncbi:hypothetical protein [Roseiterribacter gracilis]|uniref:Uncharacterized protein n=1 Tax=Roseiterribacter gracilis TaxID=2812848 RepID=A0A8S8X6G8_9PROT|nr:hypothetical protein TMPK1_10050 [Rhodospirillales bacterium TMPK1]
MFYLLLTLLLPPPRDEEDSRNALARLQKRAWAFYEERTKGDVDRSD